MDGCDVYIFIVYSLFLFDFYFILFMFFLCVLGVLCFPIMKRINITFVF